MNRPSVSFIIPCYNIGLPLLQRCVESVMALGDRIEWEAWIVDDGSDTPTARDYIYNIGDARVHYYYQENRKLSGARNTGMELARKEYIHFLDADDYLLTRPTLQALTLLERERPDMLTFRFKKVYGTDTQDETEAPVRIRYRGDGAGFMKRHNIGGSACGYFFRRACCGDLRFTLGILHEDEEFTPLLYLRMSDVLITDLPVYAYYQRPGSIIHAIDRAHIGKRYHDLTGIMERLLHSAGTMPKSVARAALERRAHMLALAMIYTLTQDAPDSAFVKATLQQLGTLRLYPLPRKAYGLRYTVFRLATMYPSWVCLYRKIRNRQNGIIPQ